MLSASARAALFAPQTRAAFLYAIVIDHESFDTPRRFVANTEDVVIEDETFVAAPFTIELPDAVGDKLPKQRLVIDNVGTSIHNDLTSLLRNILTPITVDLYVVFVEDPPNATRPIAAAIEAGPFRSYTQDVTLSEDIIQVTLGIEDVFNLSYPGPKFTPSLTPGVVQ